MDKEIKIMLQATQEAGAAILKLQQTGFTATKKSNQDILTQADLLANEILKNQLTTAFPADGWLSEECVDETRRLSCDRVWIIDPIDGTKEFVHGMPEYAISVALIEKGTPVLAAVFNPATAELFHAVKNRGAWLNNQAIQCCTTAENHLLLASRTEYERGLFTQYSQHYTVKKIGSIAYKMALVAAGQAQATFSLGFKNEWDIAGGALLVTEAGGIVTNKHQMPLVFNKKDIKVDGVVATTAESHERIFALINHAD